MRCVPSTACESAHGRGCRTEDRPNRPGDVLSPSAVLDPWPTCGKRGPVGTRSLSRTDHGEAFAVDVNVPGEGAEAERVPEPTKPIPEERHGARPDGTSMATATPKQPMFP